MTYYYYWVLWYVVGSESMATLKCVSYLIVRVHKEKLGVNCVVPQFMMQAIVSSIIY